MTDATNAPAPADAPAPDARGHDHARDHRRIGRELDLFGTDPLIGAGLPYWLPDGATVRHALEEYVRAEERRAGYRHVYSPVLGKRELYELSGHWAHYRDDMFPPMEMGSEQVLLRPSLCPHHALIYRSRSRSHRELPLRMAELGAMYRSELSGVLGGLTRVRAIQLNDAHVFCTPEQVADEAEAALGMIRRAYRALGIEPSRYRLSLPSPATAHGALRGSDGLPPSTDASGADSFPSPTIAHGALRGSDGLPPSTDASGADSFPSPATAHGALRASDGLPPSTDASGADPLPGAGGKYVDDPELWRRSTEVLTEVLERSGVPYEAVEGEAAFYGPKIDVQIADGAGRESTLSTVQVDFHQPRQFGLSYVGPDGAGHRPVMVHRSVIGSVERAVAHLLEQHGGAFPPWLAPVQVVALPISAAEADAAADLVRRCEDLGLRAEAVGPERGGLGARIRRARLVPYQAVVGAREAADGSVALRLRGGRRLEPMPVAEALSRIAARVAAHDTTLWEATEG
ncbi:aminoacyl--tRNA ligase-related protein [Nocardiopsis aegyptia]|uniref:aminoacyl--tRNA ligase-related protein n=1 Tax=Nocardiopsis aegyptia TaxID=220378 RepID=UPI0036718C35